MRVPTLVFVIALTAGCAAQPVVQTAPATTTTTAAVAAAAKPDAPAAADATGNSVAAAKVPPGFVAKTRDGETFYCKKVAKVGSNFKTETCMTAAEAEQLERQAELDRVLLRKNQTICGTAGCGGT